jgi:hypothetical protein
MFELAVVTERFIFGSCTNLNCPNADIAGRNTKCFAAKVSQQLGKGSVCYDCGAPRPVVKSGSF